MALVRKGDTYSGNFGSNQGAVTGCQGVQNGGRRKNKHQKGGGFFQDIFGVQSESSSNNEPTTPTRTSPNSPSRAMPSAPTRRPTSQEERMELIAQRRNVSSGLRRRILDDDENENENTAVNLRTGGKKRARKTRKTRRRGRKGKKSMKQSGGYGVGGVPTYGYNGTSEPTLYRGSYAPMIAGNTNDCPDASKVGPPDLQKAGEPQSSQSGGKRRRTRKRTRRHRKNKKHGKKSRHNRRSRKSRRNRRSRRSRRSRKHNQKGGTGYHQYLSNTEFSRGYRHDLNDHVGLQPARVSYSTCENVKR